MAGGTRSLTGPGMLRRGAPRRGRAGVGGETLVERRVPHAGVADVTAACTRSAATRVSAAWCGISGSVNADGGSAAGRMIV